MLLAVRRETSRNIIMTRKKHEKMIINTKKHENRYEIQNNTKVFRVFSCGLKTFVLFSVN